MRDGDHMEEQKELKVEEILHEAIAREASDVFFVVGQPVAYKISGSIKREEGVCLKPADTQRLIGRIYELAGRNTTLYSDGDDDFVLSVPSVGRFRVNIFRQRGTISGVLRVVPFDLPDVSRMGIPDTVLDIANLMKGLVIVTGTAGSGKSTTLAYIIDRINHTRDCHILTLEDPIEYLHKHDRSIVSQREIRSDTPDYSKALRAAMREAPDVILIGEMRDLETMEIAMTAAETGHLVLSTLHTLGAANTIDRIIDVFPSGQQAQIRFQLSMILKSVISQQLIPGTDGEMVPAFEIMHANSAIRTMIREGKTHQIDSVIYSSAKEGMKTMDTSIAELLKEGKIDRDVAVTYSINPDSLRRNI